MRQAFEEVLGPQIAAEVKIDTVDSFQGKQMDVVIMSCVRAAEDDAGSGNARSLLGAFPPIEYTFGDPKCLYLDRNAAL
jgi:hypothetical protein